MQPIKAAATLFAMALVACDGGEGGEAPQTTPEAQLQPAPAATAVPAAGAAAGEVMSKEDLAKQVCFFTPAEIQETLGFAAATGKPDSGMLSYGMASCTYVGSENSLSLSAIWVDPTQIAATRASMTRMSAGGKIEMLPGDPDAAYLHDQQDNGVSLIYLRGNIRMQLQVTSSRTVYADMKPRLLKLKRVP
jgi:hypothetical protein